MLKFTGITRRVDTLGRVCIPKELRKSFGFVEGQAVDVQLSGNRIIVQKENVESAGLIRYIDNLGRLVFPMEIRKNLGINKDDSLEIMVDDDRILFRKYQPGCKFCGSVNEVRSIAGKLVCDTCVGEIRAGA